MILVDRFYSFNKAITAYQNAEKVWKMIDDLEYLKYVFPEEEYVRAVALTKSELKIKYVYSRLSRLYRQIGKK